MGKINGITINAFQSAVRQCFWLATSLLLLSSSTVAGPLARSRRDVNFEDPCSVGGIGNGGPTLEPEVAAENMRLRAEGVRQRALDAKSQAVQMGANEEQLAQYSFLVDDVLGDVDAEKVEYLFKGDDVIKRHLSHVFNLTTMVNHARNDGNIGGADNDDGSHESVLRNRLDEVEAEIDSLVCDQFIGLKSEGVTVTPTIPAYTPMHVFDQLGSSLHKEVMRAYVLMRDIENVMAHLSAVYAYGAES